MTTTASALKNPAQISVARRSPAYWRVTIDNPPINVMGPEMVRQFQEVINALEADEHVRVAASTSGGMSKIGSDTTWAKSRASGGAPDALRNSGTLRMGAFEAKLGGHVSNECL